eukprot:5171638-Amphidinium_carterae.1
MTLLRCGAVKEHALHALPQSHAHTRSPLTVEHRGRHLKTFTMLNLQYCSVPALLSAAMENVSGSGGGFCEQQTRVQLNSKKVT